MAVATNNYPDITAFGDYIDAQTRLLPELPEVEILTPCIIRVMGCNPGRVRCISFLFFPRHLRPYQVPPGRLLVFFVFTPLFLWMKLSNGHG